jgi:hypothetical protein
VIMCPGLAYRCVVCARRSLCRARRRGGTSTVLAPKDALCRGTVRVVRVVRAVVQGEIRDADLVKSECVSDVTQIYA